MKRFTTILMILAILLALPLALLAAPVGKITNIEGNVDITAGEKARTANLGDTVNAGEILRAKSKAKAEITFVDGNILRLAENTRVRITDYQIGEGKTSTLDLFRGKTQSIVSALAKNARYEVHTPTAVCGVRGTNFIAFFQNGVSGFVPKEGTIYGYNRNMPQDVKIVTPGQAIMVTASNKPAAIQPATSSEVEKHVSDTAPTEKKEEEKKKEPEKKEEAAPKGDGAAAPAKEETATPAKEETPTAKEETPAPAPSTPEPLPPPPPPPAPTPTPTTTKIEEPKTTVVVDTLATTSVSGTTYFGASGSETATGTISGNVDTKTGIGSISLAMQYAATQTGYNTPQREVGSVSGTLSDGSAFQGYLAGVPGSWNGAAAGIYTLEGGAGLLLGSLSGGYDAATGKLAASGALGRTSVLATIDPQYPDPSYSTGGYAPGFLSASLDASGVATVVSVPTVLEPGKGMIYRTPNGVISAWAVDVIGVDPETSRTFSYTNASSPRKTTWTAKYGGSFPNPGGSFSEPVAGAPTNYHLYFLGDVTGTETDSSHLRLSGRDFRYMDNYYLGTANIEYWANASGKGGGAGTFQAEKLAFSTPLAGQISKMMDGTIRNTQYTSLYMIPSTATSTYTDDQFYAGSNRYAAVRYESMHFKDAYGAVNLGYRQESPEYMKSSGDRTQIWQDRLNIWYWPNRSYFTVRSYSPINRVIDRGRAFEPVSAPRFPNLDLSAETPTGGIAGSHPFFPGTLGDPAGFPADYAINSATTSDPYNLWNHGTFVKTVDWSYANANSREQIGTFSGILGVRGSDPMTLFASSTAASPVNIALLGDYAQSETYKDIHGTLGYGADISSYVATTSGYGGAYYGQIQGRLPDTGSTVPLQGNLYALYVYTPDAATNRAGIVYGKLTEGASSIAYPEIKMWQADGQMYRLADADLEKDLMEAGQNPAGVTAANLAANIVNGRGGVDGTAGFYTPTSATDFTFALGMGRGWLPSVKGFNKFGLFLLSHDFMNYSNGTPATATTWESVGWGEFGGYIRSDNSFYMDLGYWYATMDNKSWADNKLSADFNGRFLTLMKYGTMTGDTSGTYNDAGCWGASSQGYWQKSGANGGDLAFASMIQGQNLQLQRERYASYYGSGNSSSYSYSISDPAETERWGNSSWYNATNNTSTYVKFDRQGPSGQGYYKETLTTADGGATWSYAAPVYYADKAAYNTALDGIATLPTGSWTTPTIHFGDNYYLSTRGFDGIVGGLNSNFWTEKTSPILLQGNLNWTDNQKLSPSLALGDIVSVNPLATYNAWTNSELAIGGAFKGRIGFAVDSANAISGGLMALYQDPSGNAGVLYSDEITGTVHPAVGAWTAEGNLNLYQLTTTPLTTGAGVFAQNVRSDDIDRSYPSGVWRTTSETTQSIPGQPWGIWHKASGGTYSGDVPSSYTEQRIGEYNVRGGTKDTYTNISWGTPVNGITPGTVAGAATILNQPSTTGPQSFTVVQGGVIKGLFDPATTPMTWTTISQGGFMETINFMAKQAAMDDAARANFERAMKIPTFDVGTANLSGTDGNLYVAMDGIKFFRFQTEANPRIWATGTVGGSYTSNPALNTKVQLNSSSSGDLTGLKHTFEVKQWNTTTNNWGAAVYRSTATGSTDTGGILIRNEPTGRTLPTGASNGQSITINEMRGGAAGVIRPGVNATGLPGSNSFGGTAAGTVR
jgi:hypothetical protein